MAWTMNSFCQGKRPLLAPVVIIWSVLICRANLSRDYFTNRQDRYHLFKSREMTEYYATFHERLRSISYKLQPSTRDERFLLDWPTENVSPLFLLNRISYTHRAVRSRTNHQKNTERMLRNSSPHYLNPPVKSLHQQHRQ